jgi:prepilin-type N-terminal cleavage/methylation domain-containing protein
MTKNQKSYRHAFTLIELLVVISIIALLISILLPALAGARKSARSVLCLSNMRQLGLAFEMYTNDNKGFFPSNRPDPTDTTTGGSVYLFCGDAGTATLGNLFYGDYTPDKRPLNRYISADDGGNALDVTRCPDDKIELYKYTGTSYSANAVFVDDDSDGANDVGNLRPTSTPSDSANRVSLGKDSNFILATEPGARIAMYNNNPPSYVQANFNVNDYSDLFWHSGRRLWNSVYADGHADVILIEQYWGEGNTDRTGNNYSFDWNK